jgi:hypothetical protein
MFLNLLGNILASREANFVSATMFPRWASRETFEETSRITNVSTTMFPSFPQGFSVLPRGSIKDMLNRSKLKLNKLSQF